MTDFVPLLIGDEVRATAGQYVGRTGRVANIQLESRMISVYYGEWQEEGTDGSHSYGNEFDDLASDQVEYRGRKATDALVTSDRLVPPPSTEPGLEAAILGNPSDELARLVYADWLDENDEPEYGEYLRVQTQCRRAIRDRSPSDAVVDRERRLRAVLDPDWVSRFRWLTTEPLPFVVADLDPELAAKARPATLLHPRQGTVTDPAASKLGGLFLWPADEPWPVRRNFRAESADYSIDELPPDGSDVPLAPVLQLRRSDAPHLPFPDGTDLMQLFWCPVWSEEHGPEPHIVWRDSRAVRNPRSELPELMYTGSGLVPIPCRLYPEQVIEYPSDEEHPPSQQLSDDIDRWAETWPDPANSYPEWWSRSHGAKVGGHPWANQTDCVRIARDTDDGRPMRHLLSFSGSEINHCHWQWCPVEDRNLCFTGSSAR